MGRYKLTQKADDDLTQLYRHGIQAFGERQADRYFDSIVDTLTRVAQAPLQYQRSGFRDGYRRCVHPPHTIYFRIVAIDCVEIVRILRSQDPRTDL